MEEKISEIPPEKIDTIVSTKDEKKVNDKNEEGLSQIEKLVVREDCLWRLRKDIGNLEICEKLKLLNLICED